MESKVCSKCKNELLLENFARNKKGKDGLNTSCKTCEKERGRIYRENNKEKIREVSKRYLKNNPEKRKETCRKYSLNNQEKEKERGRIFRENNKEKEKERGRKYREENKEARKKTRDKYYSNNKEKCKTYWQIRRSKKLKLPFALTAKQWAQIKIDFNDECAYCGEKLPLTQEHFLALSKGGEQTIDNIIPACRSCNCSKCDKIFLDWYPNHKRYSKKREKAILNYLGYHNMQQQLSIL